MYLLHLVFKQTLEHTHSLFLMHTNTQKTLDVIFKIIVHLLTVDMNHIFLISVQVHIVQYNCIYVYSRYTLSFKHNEAKSS